MAFQSLEQRYTENTKKLYAAAKLKFEDGRPSTGESDDPILVRAPGESQKGIKTEGRGLPFVSGPRDVKRLTLFQISNRGIQFLVKQQLLQTGNTFESTRFINPAFAVSNATPFSHKRRHLYPVNLLTLVGNNLPGLLGKISRVISEERIDKGSVHSSNRGGLAKIGQLQQETFDRFKTVNLGGLLKKVLKATPIGKIVTAATAKRSVGDSDDLSKRYTHSRPELMKDELLGALAVGLSAATGGNFGGLGQLDTQYIMFKQRTSLNSAFNRGQTIAFQPKWGPAGVNYGTYFKYTDGKYLTWQWTPAALDRYSEYSLTSPIKPNETWVKGEPPLNKKRDIESDAAKEGSNLLSRYNRTVNKTIAAVTKSPTQKALDAALPTGTDKEGNLIFADPKPSSTDNSDELEEFPKPFIKYFNGGEGSIRTAFDLNLLNGGSNAKTLPESARTLGTKRISYIKDPLNILQKNALTSATFSKLSYTDETGTTKTSGTEITTLTEQSVNLDLPYSVLPTVGKNEGNGDIDGSTDFALVSFAMADKDHVQFRAFIKDLQQSISPQYKDYQYIGRIERFINFTGVQREISFKLAIVAFSEEELNSVWTRINYLTGMVFPYGFTRGILQPNIVRLTIGNVYVDQPGYITSLNTDFSQVTETWHTKDGSTQAVPISAQMDIKFVLIEKSTKIATSPFYGITEDNGLKQYGSNQERPLKFSKQIQGIPRTTDPAVPEEPPRPQISGSSTQIDPSDNASRSGARGLASERAATGIDWGAVAVNARQQTTQRLNNVTRRSNELMTNPVVRLQDRGL